MWKEIIKKETSKSYFKEIESFLEHEYKIKNIYPRREDIFKCFELTPFDDVKVVIVGQDPYHQVNQAQGLSFSVAEGIKIPPSLRNIFEELKTDCGPFDISSGSLVGWAKQGVLLMNRVLTVEDSKPNSHKSIGWETFTNKMIEALSNQSRPVVFILWGKNAQELKPLIDTQKHCVIESVHPSPLAAYRGFFGSKPFSRANDFLLKTNQSPIEWKLINHV